MPINKICVICGKPFTVSPSSEKQQCCSRKCGTELRTRNGNREYGWDNAAKERRKNDAEVSDRMRNLQPMAVEAALKLPGGQRGEQNREARIWTLVDPEGNYHRVVNLLDWARENKRLFFEESIPDDVAANRIASGFRAIASSMRGVESRKRPVCSYKKWKLAKLPEDKDLDKR